MSDLEKKARELRKEVLGLVYRTKKGHIGGCYSEMEILVSLFYDGILRYDAQKPKWSNRDRFIISKGHACAPLYYIFKDLGFFRDETTYQPDSEPFEYPISLVPGIELNTGSLGHGLGVGAGMALAGKMDKKDYVVVVLLGDGEFYEGSNWETGLFAAHHNLGNLIAIVDRNKQIVLDRTEDCNRLEPLDKKWESFGWRVKRINGHSFSNIRDAFCDVRAHIDDKPLMIIADTVKGKGVSFMEGKILWHHAVPNEEEYKRARAELD